MKRIPLTRGMFATVDADDYEQLIQWKWHFTGHYAARCRSIKKGGKPGLILMHRQLMGEPDCWVDHRNLNRLDNRKANLRVCTPSQSNMNKKAHRDNWSGCKGVSRNYNRRGSKNKPYRARITVNGVEKHLGFFRTTKEAQRAYESAAPKFHGDFARSG